MNHYKDKENNDGAIAELTLEPMEIKEEPVSGNGVSRDRSRQEETAANSAKRSNADTARRKPTGKANFLTDDRKRSERRRRERRKSTRLTGDRRGTFSRRAVKNPWLKEH